jgi:hypothetical protein
MSEHYLATDSDWKMKHVPFTPYYLVQNPDTKLWHIVEKELAPSSMFVIQQHEHSAMAYTERYQYRFL